MKKHMITLTIILLITLVSAIYSGETREIPVGFEIVNCSIINSTYDLYGLNLSWDETNIIISTIPNYKPDNLTISCWIIKYGEIVEGHYGGGSCKYNKNFDWDCSEWGECNGQKIRICKEKNNCGNTYGRPMTITNCSKNIVEPKDVDILDAEPKENKWNIKKIIIGFGLICIILGVVWYLSNRKKFKQQTPL